jgi:molecular chaperone GrpE
LTDDPVDTDGPRSEEDDIAEGPAVPEAAEPGAEALPATEPLPAPGSAEHFERRARLAEDRLSEVLAAYRQVKTENAGFRERVTRDVERQFDSRHEKLLLKFIDILDNLDRALEAAEQTYAGNPLVDGLILVRTQLLQTLQKEGLERVPVLGLPFDPAVSDAVCMQPVDDPDQNHVVVREVLRGYRLHGRVARASRVVVGMHRHGAPAAAEREQMIGADEAAAALEAAAAITAADTVPLDAGTIRQIFGGGEEDAEAGAGEPGTEEPDAEGAETK